MIKNVKLRTRITVGFALLIAMVLISNTVSIMLINNAAEKKDRVFTQYGKSSEEIAGAYADYQELKFLLRNMIYVHEGDASGVSDDINSITETITDLTKKTEQFEEYADLDNENVKKQYDVAREGIANYVGSVKECISLVQSGDFAAAKAELKGEIIDYAKQIDKEVEELLSILDDEAEVAIEHSDSIVEKQRTLVTIIAFVIVAMGILISTTISVAVRKPIRLLNEAFDKLAVGDVDVEVKKLNNDELGDLIDDFNKFVETTKEDAYIASEVAAGNLTVTVTPKGPDDILGNALARLVDDNNTVLSNIRESSAQVTTGSEQVASASQSLAQGSTQQASAIEEITASISDIAERTRKNAEQANTANTLVVSAKEGAEQGNAQMKDMISAMTEINESSENISKIIKVIDDIAFQTNILALNAAVEAARAGSHGKGFAVVAEEVRNLAGKSASAASETAEMIEDSIRKVEHGSALATETASALEEIVEAVEQIVDIISNIASASNEQATAVAQIDQAINQVSQVVQTNSATSEQCAAASEELSNQSARLREMINKFRLKSTDSYYGYESSNYSYSSRDSLSAGRTISLGDGFDKY